MHAFYCRLLNLQHEHGPNGDETAPPAAEPGPNRADGSPARPPCAARVPGAGADLDHRPSLHTLIIPRLLQRGYDIETISKITGVPSALVELMAETHKASPAGETTPLSAARLPPGAAAVGEIRRRRGTTIIVMLVAVMNIATGLLAMVLHLPALGMAATLSAGILMIVVVTLARRWLTPTSKTPRRERR